MAANWTSEDTEFHVAECDLGAGVVIQLMVERLGERGWDWQMWDPSRSLRARRGVASSLDAAKVQAELAAAGAVASARMAFMNVVQALGRAA